MSVHDLYFSTLARICSVMAGFSDPVVSAAFRRLGRSLSLIGLRTYGTDGATIDRNGSGLPILNEAAALGIDAASASLSQEDPEALRHQILDHLMTRRRRPPADLMRRMALAVYSKALRGGGETFGCQPDVVPLAAQGPWGGRIHGAWDFWDGVASMPVRVEAAFGKTDPRALAAASVEAGLAARLFSGQAFTALSLARELDERLPALRMTSLTKLSLGPFRSDVFTAGGDALADFMRQIDDLDEGWTMGWTLDQVRSLGTATRRSGLLGLASRPYERFVADPQDMHMLLPHPVYQLLNDDPEGPFDPLRPARPRVGRGFPDRGRLMAGPSSAIRIAEAAVKAKLAVALAVIGDAESASASGMPATVPSPGRMAYVPPLGGGSPKARRERTDLASALRGPDGDALLPPSRHAVLYALRRAVAVGMVVGEMVAEPLDFLGLGERNGKGLLSGPDKDRFAAIVRAKAIVTAFVAAAHLAVTLGIRAPARDGEAGPVPATSSNDAIGWLVGLVAAGVRGVADDATAMAGASQACFDAMARCREDAARLPPGVLDRFQRSIYTLDEDQFRVQGLDAPAMAGAKASVEVATKRPDEVIGNHIAKAQAMRLARMLACYDFDAGRNPFVEVGGFTFTAMGDGAPGTGKTTLIQMVVGLIKGYAETFGYPFRYENFSVDQISEYQGTSGRNCRGFIDRVLDRNGLGFGTIDDIDQVAGRRDDKRSSGGQQEVTAVLMEAFAGAGTVVRGNAAFAMFSNFPENVDDALRQRAGARWLIDGPQSREDYVDILALLLGKSVLPLGAHQLYAAQTLKRMVVQGYRQHDLPQEERLREVWDAWIKANGVPGDVASLGGYLHAIKEREPRFTGRAVKNIADSVRNRSMDVDLPDDWFAGPEAFARKPYAEKVAMLSALRKPIDAAMVIQEINRYADSEFRYADKSDEAEIARLLREHRLAQMAARRLQDGAA